LIFPSKLLEKVLPPWPIDDLVALRVCFAAVRDIAPIGVNLLGCATYPEEEVAPTSSAKE
jgi:hypothetical protein